MDATRFIPRPYHKALKALGRRKWPNIVNIDLRTGSHRPVIDWKVIDEVVKSLEQPDADHLTHLFQTAAESPTFSHAVQLVAKMLADGPKVFQPTVAQCEAMEHVSVDIQPKDYAQAFPAVVVQLPRAFAEPRQLPELVAVYHDPAEHLISTASGAVVHTDTAATFNSTVMTEMGATIEERLNRIGFDETPGESTDEIDRARAAERIAINCNLLLTMYPTRVLPLDADRFNKLQQHSRRGNPAKAEHARRMLTGEFQAITFEQSVRFHDEDGEESEQHHGGQTHGTVKPHWRKGHYRRQRVGPQRAETRLIFIRPVLVRRDRFAGDLSDTAVTYR